ncbi:MAG: endonuclease/exonuclease/phosphatase family protein [Eubacteriales bacterium]
MKIKAVTFNLRVATHHDRQNFFFNRTPLILKTIRKENPDILCFQEANDRMLEWLKVNLTEYTVVGTGRDSNLTGEANPIAFRKGMFSLFSLDQFWLSPTPDVPGSRYEEQSDCPRICMVATLKYQEGSEKRLMRVYNTHLDHISQQARLLGMDSILKRIGSDYDRMHLPLILTGDFNANPDEACIQSVRSFAKVPLTDVTESIPTSFHGYGRLSENNKIDYIFTNAEKCEETLAWTAFENDVWLSDHYPIHAVLEI